MIRILLILVGTAVLLSGCYSYRHIEWAERETAGWGVEYLTMEKMMARGYSDRTMGVYVGKVAGRHRILMRQWVRGFKEGHKYVLNHELKHARYPEWSHP